MAVITLALGIAASATFFGLIDAAVWRPLRALDIADKYDVYLVRPSAPRVPGGRRAGVAPYSAGQPDGGASGIDRRKGPYPLGRDRAGRDPHGWARGRHGIDRRKGESPRARPGPDSAAPAA